MVSYTWKHQHDWDPTKEAPHMTLNPNWCALCRKNGEGRDHLFLKCSFALSIWQKLEMQFRRYTHQQNASSLCIEVCRVKQRSKKEIIAFNSFTITLWSIWLERNNRTFNDKEKPHYELWDDIKALTGLWTNRSKKFSNNSVGTIALNLNAFVSLLQN